MLMFRKANKYMKIKKISISRKNINKQDKNERLFFYISSWFLSEIRTLKSLYFFSMNVSNAESLEIYGRNYRTLSIACLLGAKLWEGWQMLQKCYFATKIHIEYESLYSKEAKEALGSLKKYFDKGNASIIGKIRNSTFHYPISIEEKQKLERQFIIEEEDDGTDYYIGDTYEQSIFSIDQFIVTVIDKTETKSIDDAKRVLHSEIQKNIANFYRFLGEYILFFQKKCDFTQEDKQLKNVTIIRKDINIPFFFKEKN